MSKLLVALLAVSLSSLASAGDYKHYQPKKQLPTKPQQSSPVSTSVSNKNEVDVNSNVNNTVKNDVHNSSNSSSNLHLDTNLSQQQSQTSSSSSASNANSGATSTSGAGADASSASGGNTLATGSTSTTNISNVETRFLNLPSHVVPVAPSIIAGANVVQSVGACGVLQQVKREEVKGTYHGLFTDSQVSLGFRETLTGYVDSDGKPQLFKEYTVRDTTYIIGHQPVIVSSVVATGGARQFGLGGNSSSGNNGSGSLGSSGANQQMVEHIQLTECIFQVIDNRQSVPSTNAIVPTVPTISKKIPE